MRLLLHCIACVAIETQPRRQLFEATLVAAGDATQRLRVVVDSPIVPGTCYEVLLKGIWPPSDGRCVGNVLEAFVDKPAALRGLEPQAEMDFRCGIGERGFEN